MKKLSIAALSILSAGAIVVGFTACNESTTSSSNTASEALNSIVSETEEAVVDLANRDAVNFAVLTGPTGMGAVSLMEQDEKELTKNDYNFTIVSANDEIVTGLTSGEFDIAAIATNVGSNLYNKTNADIKVLAVNTLSVLHILENGDSVQSIADLKGKTLYAMGQGANPEFIIKHILDKNGLTYSTDGSDADVKLVFNTPDAVSASLASEEGAVALLAVPAATAATMQNEGVRFAVNLNDEWQKLEEKGAIAMGSVVVRTEFLQEHKEAVDTFLQEYEASIADVMGNVDENAASMEKYGIIPKAAVAKNAIPNAALTYIDGQEMIDILDPYYQVLASFSADSIGGAVPDTDFYYIAE